MTPQMKQLYLALKDLTEALDGSVDDTNAALIELSPEIVSALQQGRMVVRKYKETADVPTV